jgi:RTX calcium-binding nonapeptide repeat (4 copies)/Bacterial protein of unknown function (DUF839)
MAKKSRLKFGTSGDDTLDGTDDSEVFFGFSGNDTIFGRGGKKDVAFGGRGDDLIFGGNGKDHLFGRSGNDALVGEADKDHLLGGSGRDLLLGGPGKDVMVGGPGNDTFLIRQGTGVDIIADLQAGDRIDIRDFNFASFQAVLDAAHQTHGDVVINLGGGDQLVIDHTKLSDLHSEQFIISSQITGPSSSQSPYLVSTNSHVTIESILTVGDSIGGYKMAGIPDGLGAYDNGNGTFTVLMNHEIPGGLGAVRAHGANGAFVSQWVIDKTTLQVQSGHDLIQHVFVAADGFSVDHSAANGNGITLSRFCSADLADPSAFYNAASGLGYNGGRLYLNGEESGVEGRPFAHIASGPDAGNSYELAALGNMAYENLLANPHTGDKTVVAATDDGQNGQVYFYYGDKQSTGSAIDKAGLTGGHLFGIKVADFAATSDNAPNSTTPLGADEQSAFTLADLGDVSGITGAQLDQASENAGVASFLRPEDGAWDTINPNRFYFVTTNAFNSPSQLWAADFVDAANPALGGNIKLLLNGSEGQQMFDNITVDGSGKVTLCEDVGNNAHLGKVWQYDPATDSLTQLAVHDSSRFLSGGANFLTQDEESSGVIDISNILGNAGEHVFLIDTQAHFAAGGELVEGGQLMVMHQYLV